MTFEEIVDQAIEMVRRRGQVSYRLLKRQFDLDDEALEDLKEEILYAQPHAVDDEGKRLTWTGEAAIPKPDSPSSQETQLATQEVKVEPSLPPEPSIPDAERRHQPRLPVAVPGQRPGSPRPARVGVRLVYRRV